MGGAQWPGSTEAPTGGIPTTTTTTNTQDFTKWLSGPSFFDWAAYQKTALVIAGGGGGGGADPECFCNGNARCPSESEDLARPGCADGGHGGDNTGYGGDGQAGNEGISCPHDGTPGSSSATSQIGGYCGGSQLRGGLGPYAASTSYVIAKWPTGWPLHGGTDFGGAQDANRNYGGGGGGGYFGGSHVSNIVRRSSLKL